MKKAGPFVAGAALGMGLLLAGEGNVSSNKEAQTGIAILALDGIGATLAAEQMGRRQREEIEHYSSRQWSELPPFMKNSVTGLNLLLAYLDNAASQRQKEASSKLAPNDPCVYLLDLANHLNDQKRHLPENIRFNYVVDGIRRDLMKNYIATYVFRLPEAERKLPNLALVCEQLDNYLPIDPNAVMTVKHTTWLTYVRHQAITPHVYEDDTENISPPVPQSLASELGRQAYRAS